MPNSAQQNAYYAALTTGKGVLYDALGNVCVVGAQMPAGTGSGNVLTSDASGNLTLLAGMSLVAATPVAGYTLVNGTGTIISWTPPNDGLLHRAVCVNTLDVTSGETGGLIQVTFKAPDGTSSTQQLQAAGQTTGIHAGSLNLPGIVQAGQAVTVAQNSALSGGAAVFWCEIWGS